MIHLRIKQLRMEKGLSQNEMAERLNKSQSAYNRLEHGETKIAIEELPKIAEALECKIEDLLASTVINNGQLNNVLAPNTTQNQYNQPELIQNMMERFVGMMQEQNKRFLEMMQEWMESKPQG